MIHYTVGQQCSGTLTKGVMSVTSVLLPDGSKANIGQIVTLHGEVQHGRSHPMLESLATACVVCNNSVPTYGKKRALGSPTETALMQFAQKLGLEDLRKDWQRVKEVRYRNFGGVFFVQKIAES